MWCNENYFEENERHIQSYEPMLVYSLLLYWNWWNVSELREKCKIKEIPWQQFLCWD